MGAGQTGGWGYFLDAEPGKENDEGALEDRISRELLLSCVKKNTKQQEGETELTGGQKMCEDCGKNAPEPLCGS